MGHSLGPPFRAPGPRSGPTRPVFTPWYAGRPGHARSVLARGARAHDGRTTGARRRTTGARRAHGSGAGPHGPGVRPDLERRLGEQHAAVLAQGVATCVVEAPDVVSGRSDAERVGLPPLLERLVLHHDRQQRVLDVGESRSVAEVREVALAGAGQAPLAHRLWVEIPRRAPEEAERPVVAGEVPDAGRDRAAGTGDASHLAQAADRVVHEVHDELGEGVVVEVVG